MLSLSELTGLMLSMFKEITFEKQYQEKEKNSKNVVDTDNDYKAVPKRRLPTSMMLENRFTRPMAVQ